eukprot:gene15670-17002_t
MPLPAIDGPAGKVSFEGASGGTVTISSPQSGSIDVRIDGKRVGTVDQILWNTTTVFGDEPGAVVLNPLGEIDVSASERAPHPPHAASVSVELLAGLRRVAEAAGVQCDIGDELHLVWGGTAPSAVRVGKMDAPLQSAVRGEGGGVSRSVRVRKTEEERERYAAPRRRRRNGRVTAVSLSRAAAQVEAKKSTIVDVAA